MRKAEQTDYPCYCSSIECVHYVQCDEVKWLHPASSCKIDFAMASRLYAILYVLITENSWGILNNPLRVKINALQYQSIPSDLMQEVNWWPNEMHFSASALLSKLVVNISLIGVAVLVVCFVCVSNSSHKKDN